MLLVAVSHRVPALNRALKEIISNLRQTCKSPKTDSVDLPTERH
jgi:hypothetical protein